MSAAGLWSCEVGFRDRESIHLLEALTTVLGLKRVSRNPRCHGCRVLSIGDNLSAITSFEKERARDWALRQLTAV